MKSAQAIATTIVALIFLIAVIAIMHPATDATVVQAQPLPIYDSVTGMPLNSYAESAANSSAETIDTSPSIIHESAAQE